MIARVGSNAYRRFLVQRPYYAEKHPHASDDDLFAIFESECMEQELFERERDYGREGKDDD